jgi:hypothetical protein
MVATMAAMKNRIRGFLFTGDLGGKPRKSSKLSHPERGKGSAFCRRTADPSCARDDNSLRMASPFVYSANLFKNEK